MAVAVPVWGQDFDSGDDSLIHEHFQDPLALKQWIQGLKGQRGKNDPPPPQLPRKFRWKGRYIVSDLVDPETGKTGIVVPFIWFGQDGDVQMIAGSDKHPIYFTNFIYNNHLYTYTYKWPGLQPRFLPPLEPCKPLFEFSLEDLNAFLATSRYAGPEILLDRQPRHVHHFRAGVVVPRRPSGFHPRLALLIGDFYVDRNDSTKFWKVLHFGYQNIYDPELDEWIIIDKIEGGGGKVILPPACSCSTDP